MKIYYNHGLIQNKKHQQIKRMKKGLDNIAKHSKDMNKKKFKHAIGL